jgi:hypothetical protein
MGRHGGRPPMKNEHRRKWPRLCIGASHPSHEHRFGQSKNGAAVGADLRAARRATPPRRCGSTSPRRWQIVKTAEQRLNLRNGFAVCKAGRFTYFALKLALMAVTANFPQGNEAVKEVSPTDRCILPRSDLDAGFGRCPLASRH